MRAILRLAGSILLLTALFLCAGCSREEPVTENPEPAPAPAPEVPLGPMITTVQEFNFEGDLAGWKPMPPGVKIEPFTGVSHSGTASLKIAGKSPDRFWNFAASPWFDLTAGKSYKLTGWLRVDAISNPNFPPFIKCQINQERDFLRNAGTGKYDLARKGEWQELAVTFVAPPSDRQLRGMIGFEKGTDKPNEVTAYLDDIKLELIENP